MNRFKVDIKLTDFEMLFQHPYEFLLGTPDFSFVDNKNLISLGALFVCTLHLDLHAFALAM